MPINTDSVLDSTKKLLGMDPEFTAFDVDVVTHTNTAFGILRQLGVGPTEPFIIFDSSTTWGEFSPDMDRLQGVKSYIYTFVRLVFDPPQNSFTVTALKEVRNEMEWRLNVEGEDINPPSPPPGFGLRPDSPDYVYNPIVVNLGYMPEVTPDMDDGNVFYLTLYGDCVINPPAHGEDGQHMTMELTTNGYNVTWTSGWNWGSIGEPVLTPDKTDIISAVFRATFAEWHAGWTPGF
jgi:hypothetical protein